MELKHTDGSGYMAGGNTFNRTLWNWNFDDVLEQFKTTSFNRTLWNWNLLPVEHPHAGALLLIVPYGIETLRRHDAWAQAGYTFNRTLWNWNSFPNPKDGDTACF